MIAIVSSIAALLRQCIADAMRAVHVSAPYAPVSNRSGCNRGATLTWRQHPRKSLMCSALLCLAVNLSAPALARGQDDSVPPPAASRQGHRGALIVTFLGGALVGLAAHEAGHVIFDVAFDASPGLARVSFGPIPFFAITHRPVSPREEFTISSAGFWVQHGTSEWLLTKRPNLRAERAPFAKGLLAWNVLASVAYSGAAFARAGPAERDTRGMAISLGVAEPWVGTLLLAPAVLDTIRYVRPRAAWARWTSRAAKAGLVVLVIAADR
jgi:hypothetical protein